MGHKFPYGCGFCRIFPLIHIESICYFIYFIKSALKAVLHPYHTLKLLIGGWWIILQPF